MIAHAQKCREAFGTGGLFTEHVLKVSDAPGGSRQNLGYTVSNYRYDSATVTLRSDLQPDALGYETVTHEEIHVALAPIAEAVQMIIDMLPKKQRKHALELFQSGNERAITPLARALTPVLRSTPQKGRRK